MNRRQLLFTASLALALAAGDARAGTSEPLPVVASFSILGDLVSEVGGEHVAVTTLVGPDGDAHVFQPRPADAQAVAAARVVVVNGLGFEGWFDRLVAASGFKGSIIVAATDITPIAAEPADAEAHDHDQDAAGHDHGHDHGPIDPHAWQDVRNTKAYIATIAEGLAAADPTHADAYRANAATYAAELDALDQEIRAKLAALPAERRRIVTSHDAFGYFAHAYGLEMIAPQGVSTESEASAQDVAALIRQIREQNIPAVFVESISDPRLVEQIARESGAVVGGALYSDALSGPDGPAPTYLAMMRHNLAEITRALAGS